MRILFFGLGYHTYTRSIVAEMEALGAEVTYADLQPRSTFFKTLRTLSPTAYARYLQMHHMHSVRASKRIGYDKVVFLQAHQISPKILSELRALHSQAEFTLYNWDAITTHDYRAQIPYFNRVLTFDRSDAEKHGLGYLPLFCQRSLQGLRRDQAEQGSLFMVGNIVRHHRYMAVEAMRAFCEYNGLTFRQYLKISPVVWMQMLRTGIWPAGVSFRSIGPEHFRNLVETTQCAFDIANHSQAGQTMRLMESLCAGKKIVTNNTWVKREQFYSPDRIHIIEQLDFTGIPEFLHIPIAEPNADFAKYHIQNFTLRLLGMASLEPIDRSLR